MKNSALMVLKQIYKDYKEFAETGDGDLFDERLAADMVDAEEAIGKKYSIDGWIVIEGRQLFVSRTRKQARAFIKREKIKAEPPIFIYVGKCINGYSNIVLDV